MLPTTAEVEGIHTRPAQWSTLLIYRILGIVVVAFYLHLFVNRYIDDAYITLSYATTLANFGVWGMKPDLTSNAATSPLNVLLLAALIKVVRNPLFALYLFQIALALLIYLSLRHLSLNLFATETFGLLATGLLLTNPLLTSTQGLESYLLLALVLLASWLWDRRSYPLLGLVAGLLFLTRPDAVAVAFVFIAVLCLRREWGHASTVLGCSLIPVLPWLVFSWVHLGSLIPDTLLLKRGQASWNGYTFLNGPALYWQRCRIPVLCSVILAPGLLLLKPGMFLAKTRGALLSANPASALLLGLAAYAILHFCAYSLLHVPPYHWYYAVEIATIVLFGALGAYASTRHRSWTAGLLLCILVVSASISLRPVLRDGTPAIATNWASAQQYEQIALWINRTIPDRRIRMTTELGTVQFYAHGDMVDVFADRSAIVAELAKPHSKFAGKLLRFNFANFRPQDLSGIRYELSPCDRATIPLKQWATSTPYNGQRSWCFYDLPGRTTSPPAKPASP